MNCTSCGTRLPERANACPNCGTLTPAYHAGNGGSPNSPTAVSSQSSSPSSYSTTGPTFQPGAAKPATYYGAPEGALPYEAAPANPYETVPSNPYGNSYTSSPVSTLSPPPPPGTRRKKQLALFIGIPLLVLLLLGAGITAAIFFLVRSPGQLSAADAQQLYDQTSHQTPTINDPLTGGDNYGWDHLTTSNNSCQFPDQTLHAKAAPSYFGPCYAKATNFSDFLLQVQMTIVSGHSGGLVFRANSTNDKGYQYRVSTDGTYILNRIVLDSSGNPTSDGETVASGNISKINQKPASSYLLSVIARGNSIYLFVNGKYLDSASDDTYHSGQIGVYVDSDSSGVEASFRTIQLWKLS